MKIKATALFFTGIFHAITLYVYANPLDRNLLEPEIEGDVLWFATDEIKMRESCLTNVFHSITTNGFIMTGFTERKEGDIKTQGAHFRIEGSNVVFQVGYYASPDKITGGQRALMFSMNFYLVSIMPPWFQQYMDGPGNICLIPIRSNLLEPTTIRDIFFCRDNVAVRVRNLHGGDILSFIKLLDDCILASSVEEPE